MKIPIVNPVPALTEKTSISSDYSSGTTLSVKNSNGFSNSDLIMVGYPGQELTESTSLTATPPSVTSLTISALDFPHGKDQPVYKILFDQAEIYESTDGTNYSLITTVNLTFDKMITVYDHLAGSTSYKYKIKLKNSVSGSLSNFSDVQLGTGWPRNSVGRMIRNIRRYLKDVENRTYRDWEIMEEIKNAADEVLSEIPNAYWTLREDPRTTTASTSEYYLPTNYRAMLFLLYQYNPNSTEDVTYPLEYKPKSEFLRLAGDNTQDADDYLACWTESPGDSDYPNGYLRFYPTPESSNKNFTLWYFIDEPTFDSYGDVTSCPLPQVYEHYAVSMLSADTDIIGRHESLYVRGLRQLKQRQRREMSPKSLRRTFGRDSVGNLYGRGSIRKTQNDVINYW